MTRIVRRPQVSQGFGAVIKKSIHKAVPEEVVNRVTQDLGLDNVPRVSCFLILIQVVIYLELIKGTVFTPSKGCIGLYQVGYYSVRHNSN